MLTRSLARMMDSDQLEQLLEWQIAYDILMMQYASLFSTDRPDGSTFIFELRWNHASEVFDRLHHMQRENWRLN